MLPWIGILTPPVPHITIYRIQMVVMLLTRGFFLTRKAQQGLYLSPCFDCTHHNHTMIPFWAFVYYLNKKKHSDITGC